MAKETNLKKLITKTILRTVAFVLIAVILIFTIFCLVSPVKSGELFYSMGMKRLGAYLYLNGVEDSNDFNLIFNACIMAIAADDSLTIYYATYKLSNHRDFETLINTGDYKTSLSGVSIGTTRDFILFNYFKNGVIVYYDNEEELDSLFDMAVWYNGSDTNKSYTEFNTVRGFMEGIAVSKASNYTKYLNYLNSIYLNELDNWTYQSSSYKRYISQDARYIIEKRVPDYLNSDKYRLWKNR